MKNSANKQSVKHLIYSLALYIVTVWPVYADETSLPSDSATLLDAITAGQPMTSFRMRYEHVDQDGINSSTGKSLDQANAWTIRSLIGWQTKPFNNFALTAQIINVTQLNDAFYDGTNNLSGSSIATPVSKRKYPLVVDPSYTGINQFFIDWTGLPDTKLRMGRQSVKLDNTRFIGNVEFRQLMQVFDGLAIENKSISNLELYAAHFEAIRRITGQFLSDGYVDILHASWKPTPTFNLTGYAYWQNMPINGFNPYTNNAHTAYGGTGFSDNSNKTIGIRSDGQYRLNTDLSLLYTAEYANQDNYRGGDARIDADYWHLATGARYKQWSLRVDHEHLSSNDSLYGFQTPLATGHLFQGLADLFLVTPKDGVDDTFLTLNGKFLDLQLSAEYHCINSDIHFSQIGSQPGRDHYGKELDLIISYDYSKHWNGRLEYFSFREGDIYGSINSSSRKRDTDKLLATLMYTF